MIIAITELKLKSPIHWFPFIAKAIPSFNQAIASEGVLHHETSSKGWRYQRTLTAWESEAHMRKFVVSGAHLKAMKSFSKLANGSRYTHWVAHEVPSWEEALSKLNQA